MKDRAVFLDRDGVINRYAYDAEFGTVDTPATPEQFELLAGAGEAIAALNQMGLPVIVVSNQPGIAKGKLTQKLLDAITAKMVNELSAAGARLDQVLYCPHHPEATLPEYRIVCDCRKPKPGLLLLAAKEWKFDLAGSFLVGDGVQDILAGTAAGVATILLAPRRCTICEEFESRGAHPHQVTENLSEAVRAIGEMLTNQGRTRPPSRRVQPCVLAGNGTTYTGQYLQEAIEIAAKIDAGEIERTALLVRAVRERGGRIFFVGVGGGAGHASHAVCDFRKIAGVEAYSASDNVSELTARVNDEGWDTSYVNWLRGSRLRANDMVFVFSVGGGDLEKNISANLVRALQYAHEVGCAIGGIVGRKGGYTAQLADACVLVPVVNPDTVTPHTESFQALIWHLLVSHPALKSAEMKWESVIGNRDASPALTKQVGSTTAVMR
ncbi:MAG TPA: HAD-IIIA family hydrolase [Candidatus Acidoferrales bacterium]|nr:HAD-IIIA family hydrolase [Candidatus Acidoferrales bacterium]